MLAEQARGGIYDIACNRFNAESWCMGWIIPDQKEPGGMENELEGSSLQDVYTAFLEGSVDRDKLWMEVHKQSTICINRLCKKTGARVPPDDRADLITDTDCRIMERLDKKQHIGNVGGMVYFAASNELKRRRIAFTLESTEVQLQDCEKVAAYQCSFPGCTEIIRAPGFCRIHSGKPRIEGMALTIEQAADEVGVSVSAMWRMVWDEKIKSVLLGSRRIIKRNDLVDYLNTLK